MNEAQSDMGEGRCLDGIIKLEVALVLNRINEVEFNLKKTSVIDCKSSK